MGDRRQSRKSDRYGKKVERAKRDHGTSINDITGANMFVGYEGDKYRDNYDRIFGAKRKP
jgi:hypothetical protein